MTRKRVARIMYRAARRAQCTKHASRAAACDIAERFDPAKHGTMTDQQARNGAALVVAFSNLAVAAAWEDYRASHPAIDVAIQREEHRA